jgi:four helix bundle protein
MTTAGCSMESERQYDLQDRLIDYAVRIIRLSESLPETRAGKHVSSQILRSGTSPAPNHGEAQGAESRADFVHKLKISLKELRETGTWLKIIAKAQMIESVSLPAPLLEETDELIAILFTSIETAKKTKNDSNSQLTVRRSPLPLSLPFVVAVHLVIGRSLLAVGCWLLIRCRYSVMNRFFCTLGPQDSARAYNRL